MSEPKTAWDLADALGASVIGEKKWNLSCGLTFVLAPDQIVPLRDRLRAIPADAAEQIARLKEELTWAKGMVTKLAAEAAESVEARRYGEDG